MVSITEGRQQKDIKMKIERVQINKWRTLAGAVKTRRHKNKDWVYNPVFLKIYLFLFSGANVGRYLLRRV